MTCLNKGEPPSSRKFLDNCCKLPAGIWYAPFRSHDQTPVMLSTWGLVSLTLWSVSLLWCETSLILWSSTSATDSPMGFLFCFDFYVSICAVSVVCVLLQLQRRTMRSHCGISCVISFDLKWLGCNLFLEFGGILHLAGFTEHLKTSETI